VLTATPTVARAEFERATGWELKPEGACRGPICIPLDLPPDAPVDLRLVAERLGMPLVHDAGAGLWALGPASGPVLDTAHAPDFTLPDWQGGDFTLSSRRGAKVLILAWAPW
jgi:hypothetical protein